MYSPRVQPVGLASDVKTTRLSGSLSYRALTPDIQVEPAQHPRCQRQMTDQPARAVGPEQLARVGSQAGGRVFLFLHTDDFDGDYRRYKSAGVVFVREPVTEPYGTVAVFSDLYGNFWDLIGPTAPSSA